MSLTLEGKHALIAGGSGEMGFQAARSLAAAGCNITLMARGSEGLTTAATRLINEIDGDVLTVTADLNNRASIERAVIHAEESLGPIDILVHAVREDVNGYYDQLDIARFQMAAQTLLVGAANLVATVVPQMQQAGDGRVMFVIGQDAIRGRPLGLGTCALQHGLLGLMRGLAREVAESGVAVNAVVAGLVDTDRLSVEIDQIVAHTRRDRSAVKGDLAAGNAQRRLIEPKEIGATVLWLAQDEAKGLCGQSLVIDGGELG